jgi:hypothetical protein
MTEEEKEKLITNKLEKNKSNFVQIIINNKIMNLATQLTLTASTCLEQSVG